MPEGVRGPVLPRGLRLTGSWAGLGIVGGKSGLRGRGGAAGAQPVKLLEAAQEGALREEMTAKDLGESIAVVAVAVEGQAEGLRVVRVDFAFVGLVVGFVVIVEEISGGLRSLMFKEAGFDAVEAPRSPPRGGHLAEKEVLGGSCGRMLAGEGIEEGLETVRALAEQSKILRDRGRRREGRVRFARRQRVTSRLHDRTGSQESRGGKK